MAPAVQHNPYQPPRFDPLTDVDVPPDLPMKQMIARRFRIFVECVLAALSVWTQFLTTFFPPAGGFSTEELVGFHGLAAGGPFAIVILIWELKSTERRPRPRDTLLSRILIWLTLLPLGMGVYWLGDFWQGGYRDSLGCGILMLLFTPLWFLAARTRSAQS